MSIQTTLAGLPGTEPRLADRWFVSDGAISVGPVGFDLIARGVDAGKVPLESFVRNEAWPSWRPLADVVTVGTAARLVAPAAPPGREGTAPAASPSRPFDPKKTQRCATPRLPANLLITDDIAAPARRAVLADLMAADALACAADAKDALLLLLSRAVQAVGAAGALVHELRDGGAVIVCAHGPEMFELLGERTGREDPAVMAASTGAMVLAEPSPGPAGRAVLDRLARLGVEATAGLMLPIYLEHGLYGMLEVGRQKAFRAAEVAALEALVAALVARLEADL